MDTEGLYSHTICYSKRKALAIMGFITIAFAFYPKGLGLNGVIIPL